MLNALNSGDSNRARVADVLGLYYPPQCWNDLMRSIRAALQGSDEERTRRYVEKLADLPWQSHAPRIWVLEGKCTNMLAGGFSEKQFWWAHLASTTKLSSLN
jgi:hypothetical protein